MNGYHPLLPEDLRYIRAHFVPLEAVCAERVEDLRCHVRARRIPAATYVLDDGTGMYPPDYLTLIDDAGGIDGLRGHFIDRYRRAAGPGVTDAELIQEWEGYLTGEYGACLRRVTPENIYEKETLVRSLTSLLGAPRTEDSAWCARLRREVSRLDELVRAFAPCDRKRFGGPVSRDRLITDPRARYPWILQSPGG